MEIREITTAIVQEIGKRDARIYELELQVECLTKTLKIIAESEECDGDSFVCDFQTLQGMAWNGLKRVENVA
jgi:hypothetical protein